MALRIKPTPVLCGNEAILFEKKANENLNKKRSLDEVQKSYALFQKVLKKNPHL